MQRIFFFSPPPPLLINHCSVHTRRRMKEIPKGTCVNVGLRSARKLERIVSRFSRQVCARIAY